MDGLVTRTHANWMALLVAIGGGAFYILWPTTAPAPAPAPEREAQEGEAEIPPRRRLGLSGSSSIPTGSAQPCDAAYATARRIQFARLVSAEARRCAGEVSQPVEHSFSCRVDEGIYEIELEYRLSRAVDGAQLRFSAQYRGVRELDPGTVNITLARPVGRAACRSRGGH